MPDIYVQKRKLDAAYAEFVKNPIGPNANSLREAAAVFLDASASKVPKGDSAIAAREKAQRDRERLYKAQKEYISRVDVCNAARKALREYREGLPILLKLEDEYSTRSGELFNADSTLKEVILDVFGDGGQE